MTDGPLSSQQLAAIAQVVDTRIQMQLADLVGKATEMMEERIKEILEGQAAWQMTSHLAGSFQEMFDRAYEGLIKLEYERLFPAPEPVQSVAKKAAATFAEVYPEDEEVT